MFLNKIGPCLFDGQLCQNPLLYKQVLILCVKTYSPPWYPSTLFCNGNLRVPVNAHNHGFFHYFSQKAITYFPVPAVDFTTDLTPNPCPAPQLEERVYSVFSLSELCKFLNKWAVTLMYSIQRSGFCSYIHTTNVLLSANCLNSSCPDFGKSILGLFYMKSVLWFLVFPHPLYYSLTCNPDAELLWIFGHISTEGQFNVGR